MNRLRTTTRAVPHGLWRRTAAIAGVALVATSLAASLLATLTAPATATRWALVTALALSVVGAHVTVRLDANHAPDADRPSPRLGVPNLVTVLRGVLLAWVAGFLAVPFTDGPAMLAWAPALLYGSAAALDAVDGALARAMGRETVLGARLDMAFDAFGLLVAPLVAAVAGQVPWWYLSVGLARYVFVAGVRVRERRGLPVFDLPTRASRRILAGLQMAFVAAALTPAVSPSLGRVGAALFGGGLLLGFARDWLYVSGRLTEEGTTERDEHVAE